MRSRQFANVRGPSGAGAVTAAPALAAFVAFLLQGMLAWVISVPEMVASHAANVERTAVRAVVWAAVAMAYVTLRRSGRIGSGAHPALTLAAFAMAGLEITSFAAPWLDRPSIRETEGYLVGARLSGYIDLVDATASLAFGLGMGLACVVGVIDFVRIRRGQGWAVDDA